MRRRFVPLLTLITIVATLALLAGCGGNASPAPTASATPTPTAGTSTTPPSSGGTTTPPTTTPTSTPPSTTPPSTGPTGSTGTGTSGSAPVNNDTVYQASLVSPNDRMVHGTVTIDADGPTGRGSYTFTGQQANTSYTIRVCDPVTVCNSSLVTGTTDATGSASGTFQVPAAATWMLPYETDPVVIDMGGLYVLITAWSVVDNTSKYTSTIFKDADNSAAGRATVNGNSLHLQLHGLLAGTTYQIAMRLRFGGKGGESIGEFTTDMSGNVDTTLTLPSTGTGIGISRLYDTGAGMIDGFLTRQP